MSDFSLQNIPYLNQLIAWWDRLSAMSGLSHTSMVIITGIFISLVIFFTGAMLSLFLQSLSGIFSRKSSNNPFDEDDEDEDI